MRPAPWRRAAAAGAAAALLMEPTSGRARPYTVEDLVHQESFGQLLFDPAGRVLLYERRCDRTLATHYSDETRHEAAENQIRIVRLAGPPTARPLIPGDPTGVTLGPISPDGRRVAVYGSRRGNWQLGVVTLADRRVRWLRVWPEFPYRTRTVQWRSAAQLIAIGRPRRPPPLILRINSEGMRDLPVRWARTHRGLTSATAIGSGRYFEIRPRKPPSHLLQIDVRSGRITPLAAGEIEDLEVAPDGRHAAFAEAGPDLRLAPDQPVQGPNGTAWHRGRLGIVDLVKHRVLRPAPAWDLAGQLLSWSPSGRQLLVFARRDGALWTQGAPLRVTADGALEILALGGAQPVLHARPEAARAVWLGETPAVLVRRGRREDWVAIRDGVMRVLTADLPAVPDVLQPTADGALGVAGGRAWRITPRGAAPLSLSTGLAPIPTMPLWQVRLGSNPPEPTAAMLARREAGAAAVAVGTNPLGVETPLPASATRFAFAPRTGALAALTVDRHGVERMWVRRPGTWVAVDIAKARQRDLDPLRAVAVRHPKGDIDPQGRPLVSWLYLPPRAPGAPPPPLIVVPYPGQRYPAPSDLADYGVSYHTPSLPILVGAGYAVLTPSLPLGEGAEPAAGLADRVLGIVTAAAAQHPGAFDPARLALWGHSFGGYGVLAIIGQTDRFAAAVDMAGPADLISIWGTFQAPDRIDPSEGTGISGELGWTEDSQGSMHAPPWRDPARYRRNSPIFQADRIHTPLLVLAGDQDHIPLQQDEEIFSALYRQDRDAMLVTYWGESHILYSPGNVRDAYRRGLAWIEDNLTRPVRGEVVPPAASPGLASATTAPSFREPPP